MYKIDLANQQSALVPNEADLIRAIESILLEAQIAEAEISLAVVDDRSMHELNRKYLDHDWPTDVLSFVLEQDDQRIEGQLIVSSETAITNAADYEWPAEAELLLYVVHGTLHLVGYLDDTPEAKQLMREAERRHLAAFGLLPPWDEE
jgi:probable rRNA maturation factor